jgi:ribosomal protein S1
VLEVDVARKRIALSIKQTHQAPHRNSRATIKSVSKSLNRREVEALPIDDALAVLKQNLGNKLNVYLYDWQD